MVEWPWTPLLFGLAFVAVTAARSLWLRRTAGINPYVIDYRDPVHRFIAHVFFAVVAGIILYFAGIAAFPSIEQGAGELGWASSETMRWISVGLMAASTVWTAWAQIAMGNSWRIGIPSGEAPALRTHGPFALSRNPIFLGMLTFVFAMTLWSMSAVTLAILTATYLSLEVQIRGEEIFLERAHGETYRAYCSRVRRWI
jgi:protein-S-isoprenylcysteine O-methyltransferase Ste14